MSLKNRLAFYTSLLFGVAILVASVLIYFFFSTKMIQREYKNLESKTLLAAFYYLEEDEVSHSEHQSIQNRLSKSISKKNILVLNEKNKKFGGNMVDDVEITENFVETIRKNKEANFRTDNFFYSGLFYHDNQGDFVIITRESTDEFYGLMNSLLQILVLVSVIGLLVVFLFGQLIGHIAYQPISLMMSQIKSRNFENFQHPIQLEKTYKEVEDLVKTYNHFVERLGETFLVQKNFIDYVSHEFRTPMTAILGTLEVTKQKERSVEEYKKVNLQLANYVEDLRDTLDQMMILSGVKTNLELSPIRIDEIIFQMIEQEAALKEAKFQLDFELKNQQLLNQQGNEKMLRLAILNILENAIKYSHNQSVKITISEEENHLQLQIKDQGIGIEKEDLHRITSNFYRGSNTSEFNGKGIGLSLANIIFKIHHIQLKIESDQNGTTVFLTF